MNVYKACLIGRQHNLATMGESIYYIRKHLQEIFPKLSNEERFKEFDALLIDGSKYRPDTKISLILPT